MRARPALLALCTLALVAGCGSNKLQQSYDACKTDLATAKGQVTTCQSASSDCTANLDTCQTNVGACSSALTTCQTDVESCKTDLTSARGDLSNCQGSLSTCQADLGTAQAALGALTATDGDLTSALTTPSVSFVHTVRGPNPGYGVATGNYTFNSDGSFSLTQGPLACMSGSVTLGPTQTLTGTWQVSGSTVTLTFTGSQTTTSLTAVKASDGTVDLLDFAMEALYVPQTTG